MRMIPSDFWNQIFLPLFVFGKSPKPRKIVFRKIFFSKSSRGRNSQYFLTGLVLNERYFNFAHTYRADFEDFALGGSENIRNIQKARNRSLFRNFRTPKGQSLQNRRCTYVRNWNIFHLRPIPSKILRIEPSRFFEKMFSGKKKVFGVLGIPQEQGQGRARAGQG